MSYEEQEAKARYATEVLTTSVTTAMSHLFGKHSDDFAVTITLYHKDRPEAAILVMSEEATYQGAIDVIERIRTQRKEIDKPENPQ